jgi:hypothetical protein
MNFPLTNVFPHEVYQPCDSDKWFLVGAVIFSSSIRFWFE